MKKTKTKNRTIYIVSLIGILIFIFFIFYNSDGRSILHLSKPQNATKSFFAMDTYMELNGYGDQCEEALDQAEKEINRLDQLLSTGKEDSEITLINKNKRAIISEDTQILLQKSEELYKKTNGLFDITIYPVMRAWGFTDQNYRVPTQQTLAELLKNVDASKISYYQNTNQIIIENAEAEIDFGGIAKGYTSERVKDIFTEYHLQGGIINLGGNVQVIGTKTDGSLWKVGIKNPDASIWKDNYVGYLELTDRAVITSGGYERYFEENGQKYHHIIDPRTGYPADQDLMSVTIISENGMIGDGLSTSLFIMGKEEAISFWKSGTYLFDMILMTKDGNIVITPDLMDSYHSDYQYEVIE